MHPNVPTLTFVLLLVLGYASYGASGYLINTWSARDLELLGQTVYGSKCYKIPSNLTLCYNIGYPRMRLPNFMNHDTIDEAISQSAIWLALVRTKCHDDLRVFLCSLYAPVCLNEPTKLKPCRSLCESVRRGCLPKMRAVGYEWPDILRCHRFPTQDNLCVPPRSSRIYVCRECSQASTEENIVSSYCGSQIVLKARIREDDRSQERITITFAGRKEVYKGYPGNTRDFRRNANITGYIKINTRCVCQILDSYSSRDWWLVMGRLVGDQLEISFLMKWVPRQALYWKSFMRGVRRLRRNSRNPINCRLPATNSNKRKRKKKKKNKRRRKKKKNRNRRRRKNGRRNNRRRRNRLGRGQRRQRERERQNSRRGEGRTGTSTTTATAATTTIPPPTNATMLQI